MRQGDDEEDRLDPDALLSLAKQEERQKASGKLRIFFGMSAGVGKTYAMLEAAHQFKREGGNVVIGTVNTHGRVDTAKLVSDLPQVPEKWIRYKDTVFEELDIDEILRRKPQLVLIDELAHTNVPGSRHPKRWQDVLEILDAGIDVYTTLNVQHIESRKDIVENITKIPIRETVPDLVLERASQIELIDITPDDLLKRLSEGKVYLGDKSKQAAENFFKEDRLTALREIALRITAEKVDHDLINLITAQDSNSWKATERIMVVVSPDENANQLIRATRRYAYSQGAQWIVLYVDTGNILTDEERTFLSKNFELARELGADVVTTIDTDLYKGIQRVAKQKHVTQLVIGQGPRYGFLSYFFRPKDILYKLATEDNDIDLHIIRQPNNSSLKKDIASYFKFTTKLFKYALTFILFLILTAINLYFLPQLGYQTSGVLFLIGMLLFSPIIGRGPTLFAALLVASTWWFVFFPVVVTDEYEHKENIVLFLSFFVGAIITGILSSRHRESERMMRMREDKTQALYEIVGLMISSTNTSDLFHSIAHRLGAILDGTCTIATINENISLVPQTDCPYINDPKEYAVAMWSLKSGKSAGWSTDTIPSVNSLYIPLKGYNEVVGILTYSPHTKHKLIVEEANLLHTVAQQLGIFLERYRLEKKARQTEYVGQVEKIHQAILNSVAYEFREPMAEIIESSLFLYTEKNENKSQAHMNACKKLSEAVSNLNHVVNNVIEMSRLSSGFLTLKIENHNLRQFIDTMIQSLQKPLRNFTVKVNIPNDLPQIAFDFNLMEIVFSNIILNAVIYSPPNTTIEISAHVEDQYIVISIGDEGPGIPHDSLERIFDRYYRLPGKEKGGTGLGLSVAKAIIEIHNGKIEARNRDNIGTEFVVSLPLNT